MSALLARQPAAIANVLRATRCLRFAETSNKNPGDSQGFRSSRHGAYPLSRVPERRGLHASDSLVLHPSCLKSPLRSTTRARSRAMRQ